MWLEMVNELKHKRVSDWPSSCLLPATTNFKACVPESLSGAEASTDPYGIGILSEK